MAKVMVIDDNRCAALALAALLRQLGHQVVCLQDPQKALLELRRIRPDLVVLDVWMPRMDGLELLQQVRDDPGFCNIPVVMFSAAGDEEARAEAYRLGAVDYIMKGRDWQTLRERLAKHLASVEVPSPLRLPGAQKRG